MNDDEEKHDRIEITACSRKYLNCLGLLGLFTSFILNLVFDQSPFAITATVILSLVSLFFWRVCYIKKELSARWKFFGTAHGKEISAMLYILCTLNLAVFLSSEAASMAAGFSNSLMVLSFLLGQLSVIRQEIARFFSAELSFSVITDFHRLQCILRVLSLLCYFSLTIYALVLPVLLTKSASKNIATTGSFLLILILLPYWYLELKACQLDLSALSLYRTVYGIVLYKLMCSYLVIGLLYSINFVNLENMELAGLFIAVILWIAAFVELIALKNLRASEPVEDLSERAERDYLPENLGLGIIFTERLAQLVCMMFGISWLGFITYAGTGPTYGFFGLTITLFLAYWHYDPRETFFAREERPVVRFGNSWQKILNVLVSGQIVFLLKNEASKAKAFLNDIEAQSLVVVSILAFSAAISFWIAGVLRVVNYIKTHASAVELNHEEDHRIASEEYVIRNTCTLKIVSVFCNLLVFLGHVSAFALAVSQTINTSLSDSLVFSRRCIINWAVITTAVISSLLISKVAFINEPYLTRMLLKGITNLALGLLLAFFVRVLPNNSSGDEVILLNFITFILYYTTIGLYAAGGLTLLILHCFKVKLVSPPEASFPSLLDPMASECPITLPETQANSQVLDQPLLSATSQSILLDSASPPRRNTISKRRFGSKNRISTLGVRYYHRNNDKENQLSPDHSREASREQLASYYKAFTTLANGAK